MIEIIPNYHPIMVHFTTALISTSLGMLILAWILVSKKRLHEECLVVSRWCLWLGAVASILTVIAGFHAYYTVAHDAPSHHMMTIHRNWGITTFVVILLMAIWSIILYIKHKTPRFLFALGMFITFSLVLITAWFGAELVFRYGLGVMSIPQSEAVGHQHSNEAIEHQDSSNNIKQHDHGTHEH